MKKILTLLTIFYLSTICFAQDINNITIGSTKKNVKSELGLPISNTQDSNNNETWIYENIDNIFNLECSNFGNALNQNEKENKKKALKQLKTLVIKFNSKDEVTSYSYNIINY